MCFIEAPERRLSYEAISTLLLAPGLMFAQTVDTGILGTVTDPSGAVIPNAIVVITQAATGLTRSVTTAQDGNSRRAVPWSDRV